jgi:hypothetical protein
MAMGKLGEKVRAFWRNRWLVFVGAMWMQSMAGTTYIFGAISPVVKARLGYDQRQVAALGVAKNLGGCLGLLAGTLSATWPPWALLAIGAAQNFAGYGWLWLVVDGKAPALPLWLVGMLCAEPELPTCITAAGKKKVDLRKKKEKKKSELLVDISGPRRTWLPCPICQ